MHRTGNGNVVAYTPQDLEKARARWFSENRTVHTYCTKAEWDEIPDDLGGLVAVREDGTEFRIHATVRSILRKTESYRITHNCLLVGRPGEYIQYPMTARAEQEALFNGQDRPAT